MATSNDQPRSRQSEPVQFWLAIAMVSLALHSVFLFGIQRWAKVAVLQPETGGPIEVELLDAAPSKSEQQDGAIAQVRSEPEVVQKTRVEAKPPVQAQPQPSEPEPEVVQEQEPKPKPKPKPEKSIAPPSQPKKQNQVQSSPKPRVQSSPKPKPTTPSTFAPVPKDLPNLDGLGKTRSFEAQTQQPQHLDGRSGTLTLMPLPTITLSRDFANDVGDSIQVSLTFAVKCLKSEALVCLNSELEFSSYTPPPGLSSQYDQELEQAIEKWFKTLKVSSLNYTPDPVTDIQAKADTLWNIQVTLQVKK